MSKRKKKGHGIIIALLVVLTFAMLLVGTFYVALTKYKINTMTFEGTNRYSDEQLKEYIFSSLNTNNMLLLRHDLKNYVKTSIPFIETYEINLAFPDTVNVVLYEKKIVAYVIYKGNYMYFDKDGIIVESSNALLSDVPLIEGLNFDSIVLYNPLQVGSDKVFNVILDLSQNLQKYELNVDKIQFQNDLTIVLHLGDVRVNLGEGNKLSEKLNELKSMEKELQGLKGVLHMEKFEEGAEFITFKKD